MNKPTKRWIEKKVENYIILFSGTTFSDSQGVQAWLKNAMTMAMRDAVEQTVNLNYQEAVPKSKEILLNQDPLKGINEV